MTRYTQEQGCQWEVMKKVKLHFVVSMCVRSTCAMPEGAKTEAPKGLRERNMSLYNFIVSGSISSDLEESQCSVYILVQKNADFLRFRGRLASLQEKLDKNHS